MRAAVDNAFRKAGLSDAVVLEITAREAAKTYAAMGIGVTILNGYYVTKSDRRRVAVVDVSKHFEFSGRGLLTRRGRTLSSTAAEFVEMVLKPIY